MKLIASVAATLVLLSGIAYALRKPASTRDNRSRAARNSGSTGAEESCCPIRIQAAREQRITDLIRMTLEEKLAMLGTDPTIPRLGIVGTNHVEGLHGLALGGPGGWGGRGLVTPTTQFPQSRGLGQTWDPGLLKRAAAEEAYETRWAFNKYHKGGLVVRAPNADLSRDPRGAAAKILRRRSLPGRHAGHGLHRGIAGQRAKTWMTASLLKHFLANSNEDGRAGSSSNFDNRLFHEYYSVPFRMAIEEGHANAMMTAYNSWNKIPMGANPVLRSVVMKQWGFDGIICTDAGALGNMVHASHTYATIRRGRRGRDPRGHQPVLENATPSVQEALKQGLITEADIDAQSARGFPRDDQAGHAGASRGAIPSRASASRRRPTEAWTTRGWWAKNKALARKVTMNRSCC